MANGATAPARRQDEWLSIEDFCEELGVPKSTAYKWAEAGPEAGRFPRYRRLPNGRIRIRRDWFEEWVDGLPAA
jgi:excisionase family DNA binding protein